MQHQYYTRNRNGLWVKVPKRRLSIRNHTPIPDDVIRAAVAFVRPPGIQGFTVYVCKSRYDYAGWATDRGIKLRIGVDSRYPRKLRTYQIGQLKGRRYYLGSLVECLLYLAAHELMHVRQHQVGPMRGRVWGARGKFSEIETESWAIKKLREYRRGV